jgi:probable rRNA maturation factor
MPLEVIVYNTTDYKYLPSKRVAEVAKAVLKGEKIKSADVSIVLTDNKSIRKINKQYLNHNYYTDVISFTLDEKPALVGEIYISVDKAREQAAEYGVSQRNEILRLAAHGALHLAGYDDNSLEERNNMHKLEDIYIEHFIK